MDTLSAMVKAEAARAAGNKTKVFDWNKAAHIIRERKPSVASAGLSGDWERTGGDIYRNGAIVPRDETYTYLASVWATPELDIDGDIIDCWIYEDETEWNANTYWPDEAKAIL